MNKKRKNNIIMPENFSQFVMLFGIEESNSIEEAMDKALGSHRTRLNEVYVYLNEILSKNYNAEELTAIWNRPGPNIVFGYEGRTPPLEKHIIWILFTNLRDMCAERLGLQEPKPRHPEITHKAPIGGF